MSIKLLYPIVVVGILACSNANAERPRLSMPSRSSELITNLEMTQAHADVNSAYDAIARLRPNWLASHGVTSAGSSSVSTQYAMVFVDGQQYGNISSLRNIQAYNVATMRYYDVTQAGAKFGIRGGSSGVIEITTR